MSEVIIVGAGPAGLKAGIVCAKHGLSVTVIDEYMQAGGRLLGQLYEESPGNWWNGIHESEKLYEEAHGAGVNLALGTSVTHIEKHDGGWFIHTGQEVLSSAYLLLATGAAESPVPVKGWTLPGVMSIGAAQVMTNVQRVKPGDNGVIIGVSILGSAIAMELEMADVNIKAMMLPEKNEMNEAFSIPAKVMEAIQHVSHLAPSKLVKVASPFMKLELVRNIGARFFPKKGFRMWGIPVHLRKAAIEIIGENQVEGVKVADIDVHGNVISGSEDIINADFVCIAGGLTPLAELAGVAGCPFIYVEELGGYIPLHNEFMETALTGLYVCGNITGIEGAKVAIGQGETAGYAILNDYSAEDEFLNELRKSVTKLDDIRKSAPIKFNPEIEKGREKIQLKWEEWSRSSKENHK